MSDNRALHERILAVTSGDPDVAAWSALTEDVAASDRFELLGLPAGYSVDHSDLRRGYMALSRRVHPDLIDAGNPKVQECVMRISAEVNEAYNTLTDPILRAEYVLRRAGGKSAAEDKRVPPQMLTQSLMVREEIEEAQAAGDDDTLHRIAQESAEQKLACERRIAKLADPISLTDAMTAAPELRDALRLELNAWKYLQNLVNSATEHTVAATDDPADC